MSGRRATLKAIDWLAFAERVPPNQRTMFNALKTRSDAIAAKSVYLLQTIYYFNPEKSLLCLLYLHHHFTSEYTVICSVEYCRVLERIFLSTFSRHYIHKMLAIHLFLMLSSACQ